VLTHGAEVFHRKLASHLVQLGHGHRLELGNIDRSGSYAVLVLDGAALVPAASLRCLATVTVPTVTVTVPTVTVTVPTVVAVLSSLRLGSITTSRWFRASFDGGRLRRLGRAGRGDVV